MTYTKETETVVFRAALEEIERLPCMAAQAGEGNLAGMIAAYQDLKEWKE